MVVITLSTGSVAAHDLVIQNKTDQDLVSVSVRPGQVENFRRMPSNSRKTLEVTLPSGQCETVITARLEDGQTARTEANVCGGFRWTLGLNIY